MKPEQNEYMVRWKRTHKLGWYYLPCVFHTQEAARSRAEHASKGTTFYRIQVVEMVVKEVWSLDDDGNIQGSTVGATIQEDG